MKTFDIEKFRTGDRVNIEGVILKTLALAGLLTVAIVAPNALQLLRYIDQNKKRKKKAEYLVTDALKRLESKRLIYVTKNGRVRLSDDGVRKLHLIEHGTYPLPKKKWDGKWRIVSFDVNEKRKKLRDKLRILLRQVGFVRLQDSVWVYPYDVEEVIDLINVDGSHGKEILYITATTTGKDNELKKYFKL